MFLHGDRRPTHRIARDEVHPGVDELEPELVGETHHRRLRGRDPLAAQLDDLVIGHTVRPETSPDPVSGLQDENVDPTIGQAPSGHETRHTGADHDHLTSFSVMHEQSEGKPRTQGRGLR